MGCALGLCAGRCDVIRLATAMQETLPALLDESKPSWIRDVKLHRFE
jgi:hypothetical protein